MTGPATTVADPQIASIADDDCGAGEAAGRRGPILNRAAVVEATVTTTASAAMAVVILRWLVPVCFAC